MATGMRRAGHGRWLGAVMALALLMLLLHGLTAAPAAADGRSDAINQINQFIDACFASGGDPDVDYIGDDLGFLVATCDYPDGMENFCYYYYETGSVDCQTIWNDPSGGQGSGDSGFPVPPGPVDGQTQAPVSGNRQQGLVPTTPTPTTAGDGVVAGRGSQLLNGAGPVVQTTPVGTGVAPVHSVLTGSVLSPGAASPTPTPATTATGESLTKASVKTGPGAMPASQGAAVAGAVTSGASSVQAAVPSATSGTEGDVTATPLPAATPPA